VAMALAARNAIDFPRRHADLTRLDAYALCSIAVSFRRDRQSWTSWARGPMPYPLRILLQRRAA